VNWQLTLEQWASPRDAPPLQRRNFLYAQLEGVGISLANAASPFLAVFVARLGATNFQVGLLSALPAFTGLLLALALGRLLQRQRQIIPWYAWGRFLSIIAFAGMALATLVLPARYAIVAILAIWAVSTVPQTVVSICFSLVMNAVAGPNRRYDLLSRRWSLMGLITAIAMAIASPLLAIIRFPLNYQLLFIVLSLGGFIAVYFSLKIKLPEPATRPGPPPMGAARPGLLERLARLPASLRSEPAFAKFTFQRFIYLAGVSLAVPIFPLYYVRVAQASDASIGLIGTSQTLTLLIGYWLWTRLSQRRGSRIVLLTTTLALALFPALTAATSNVALLVALAGASGIFQAGMDLVFFDELMKRVPDGRAPMFIAVDTTAQNLSAVAAPLAGTLLADQIGLGGALIVSAGLRLAACFLFARDRPMAVTPEPAAG
jgi:MFS family permease